MIWRQFPLRLQRSCTAALLRLVGDTIVGRLIDFVALIIPIFHS